MALISKPQNSSPSISKPKTPAAPKPAAGGANAASIADKRRKRTLAKQQQISENMAHLANELLAKTQEGVSAIEELKSAMEQIAAASEENAGAAEESLSAVDEITKTTAAILKDAEIAIAKTENSVQSLHNAAEKVTAAGASMKGKSPGSPRRNDFMRRITAARLARRISGSV